MSSQDQNNQPSNKFKRQQVDSTTLENEKQQQTTSLNNVITEPISSSKQNSLDGSNINLNNSNDDDKKTKNTEFKLENVEDQTLHTEDQNDVKELSQNQTNSSNNTKNNEEGKDQTMVNELSIIKENQEVNNDVAQNNGAQEVLVKPKKEKTKTVGFVEVEPIMHDTNPSVSLEGTIGGSYAGQQTVAAGTYMGNTVDVQPTMANYANSEDITQQVDGQKKGRPTLNQLLTQFQEPNNGKGSQENLIIPDENKAGAESSDQTNKINPNTSANELIKITSTDPNLGLSRVNTAATGQFDDQNPNSGNVNDTKVDIDQGQGASAINTTNPNRKSITITTTSSPEKGVKFNWIEGVFVRCLLNIWGVMLFLRMSWIVGQAGVFCSILIILLATAVTTITTTSMSAVCTNGSVKGGGAYFLISRSLGPEFGGAIGLIFSVANAVAVAMYIAGFTETVCGMYTDPFTGDMGNDNRVIGIITVIILLCITQAGMAWESKMQIVLLIILLVSILNWVAGSFYTLDATTDNAQGFFSYSSAVLSENMWPDYTTADGKSENFFSIFSLFFPAATGILAGSNISGDLDDPAVAIPKGTFLAIAVTSLVYIGIIFTLGGTGVRYAGENPTLLVKEFLNVNNETDTSQELLSHYATYQINTTAGETCTPGFENSAACQNLINYPTTSIIDSTNCTNYYNTDNTQPPVCLGLLNDMQYMANYSSYKHIITAGIFAATLSSALACLVSAPKIFQALCKDEIFPYIGYFAKGYGPNEDPRRAYVLCFFVSIAFILIGDLNTIAPIISNFFLASYCLINYSCFMASLSKTPGWRPGFKYYNKWLSLFGAVVCFIIMFVMSWIAGLITIAITFGLYLLIHFKQKEFDVTNNPQAINWGSSSLSYIEALNSTQKLEQVRTHVKNFRPGTLALVGDPRDRPALAYLAGSITKDTSLMICGNFIDTASVVPNAVNKEEASQPENPYLIDTKAKAIKSWFQEKNIKSFYTTFFGNSFFQAANGLIQTAGVGGLKPNTLLMGFKSDWKTDKSENVKNYIDVIQRAFICKYGVGLLRMPKGIDEIAQDESMNLKDGDMMKNAREAAANMYFKGQCLIFF